MSERPRGVMSLDAGALGETSCWAWLTPRQREVARLLVGDKTNAEIAAVLGMSVSTTKSHVHAVLTTLALRSRHELRHIHPPLPPQPRPAIAGNEKAAELLHEP